MINSSSSLEKVSSIYVTSKLMSLILAIKRYCICNVSKFVDLNDAECTKILRLNDMV